MFVKYRLLDAQCHPDTGVKARLLFHNMRRHQPIEVGVEDCNEPVQILHSEIVLLV